MFRALLTYPLILAVAVGPMLCCCTGGRLVASPAPASPAAPPIPTIASTHSCCAHKNLPHPAEPTGTDPKPADPDQPCPCKDRVAKVEAVQTATPSLDAADHFRIVSLDLILPVPCPESLTRPGGSWPDVRDRLSGSPSASDLLYAHHKLRC
ncbi:MAG TPA: hypothetical protein VKE74_01130 [Gemmataceae bacterium]|nr:hypothetical protein [Gemmataceae bacterium]